MSNNELRRQVQLLIDAWDGAAPVEYIEERVDALRGALLGRRGSDGRGAVGLRADAMKVLNILGREAYLNDALARQIVTHIEVGGDAVEGLARIVRGLLADRAKRIELEIERARLSCGPSVFRDDAT